MSDVALAKFEILRDVEHERLSAAATVVSYWRLRPSDLRSSSRSRASSRAAAGSLRSASSSARCSPAVPSWRGARTRLRSSSSRRRRPARSPARRPHPVRLAPWLSPQRRGLLAALFLRCPPGPQARLHAIMILLARYFSLSRSLVSALMRQLTFRYSRTSNMACA